MEVVIGNVVWIACLVLMICTGAPTLGWLLWIAALLIGNMLGAMLA